MDSLIAESAQIPPFKHGFIPHSFTSMSQSVPRQPVSQWHTYSSPRGTVPDHSIEQQKIPESDAHDWTLPTQRCVLYSTRLRKYQHQAKGRLLMHGLAAGERVSYLDKINCRLQKRCILQRRIDSTKRTSNMEKDIMQRKKIKNL